MWPWDARIYRLSDDHGMAVGSVHGGTEAEALREAREWIEDANRTQQGHTLYAFDDGTEAPEPETRDNAEMLEAHDALDAAIGHLREAINLIASVTVDD
jgi:hypothetical protein